MLSTPQDILKEYRQGIQQMLMRTDGEDKIEVQRQDQLFLSAIQHLDILVEGKAKSNNN